MSAAVGTPRIGYFGKYPGYRDFVQRDLPVEFTEPWRAWAGSVMETGFERCGDRWLDIYLSSPVWRLGICNKRMGGTWLGALMPSQDARGRYFPLVVALHFSDEPLVALLERAQPFLTALENAMVATLVEPYPDTTQLAAHFDQLAEAPEARCLSTDAVAIESSSWHRSAALALDEFVARSSLDFSAWHAANTATGEESFAVFGALPAAADFVALQEATVPPQVPADSIDDAGDGDQVVTDP